MSQKPSQRTRKEFARQRVAINERRYTEYGNAVFAWEAIAWCLDTSIPMPAWVIEYLKDVARDMARLSRERIPRSGQIDAAIAAVILRKKRRGASNPFTWRSKPAHDLTIAFDVYQTQGKCRNYDWNSIFDEAALMHARGCEQCKKRPPSRGTVKRLWYKYAFEIIPQYLLDGRTSKKISDILR